MVIVFYYKNFVFECSISFSISHPKKQKQLKYLMITSSCLFLQQNGTAFIIFKQILSVLGVFKKFRNFKLNLFKLWFKNCTLLLKKVLGFVDYFIWLLFYFFIPKLYWKNWIIVVFCANNICLQLKKFVILIWKMKIKISFWFYNFFIFIFFGLFFKCMIDLTVFWPSKIF